MISEGKERKRERERPKGISPAARLCIVGSDLSRGPWKNQPSPFPLQKCFAHNDTTQKSFGDEKWTTEREREREEGLFTLPLSLALALVLVFFLSLSRSP